uniref:extracellular calcium-sensing receptor-like n=1 Tax=Solea senegalensis TaxID=28829 RepID=UPI001CD8D501|nr:extracellular calcium-sensing receptor-like [Solea senegalensis]
MTSLALFSLLCSISVLTLTDSSLSGITTAAPPTASKCNLLNSFQPGFFVQGDYVIGGIFPLHFNLKKPDLNGTYRPPPIDCNGHRLYPRAFRWAQTMRLAVEEINQNPVLLPNHTLGYNIYDSCGYPLTGQRAVLSMLNGVSEENSSVCTNASSLLAVIGAAGSAQSIVLSRILQPFRIPMISYASSCTCLSDRQKYPTFFRVIPSDYYQVKAIARMLVHFNWTWVGLLRGDNDYGLFAAKGLLKELQETKVCVAYQEMIPLPYTHQGGLRIMKVMRSSTAKVVVVFANEGEMTTFLRDYITQNITGIQWVGSDAFISVSAFSEREYYPYLGGTIGFGIKKGHISRLGDFLQTVNPNRYPDNVLLQHYLQEVNFQIAGEEVDFDAKGDSVPYYDIVNWQRGSEGNTEFIDVGLFDGTKAVGEELLIQEDRIMWAGHQSEVPVSVCSASCLPGFRKAVRRGEPICCFDCVPCDSGKISNQTNSVDCTICPEDFWSNNDRTACISKKVEYLTFDSLGIALTVMSVVGACFTLAVCGVFFCHRHTAIVRVNNSELSFFILFALTLCFLCCLLFIGKPTYWSCMLRHTAFSITFSLCISCILGKTLVVLAAFTATRPGHNIMKWLGPNQQRTIISSCTMVQVVICAAWLIDVPPFPSRNTQYERSKIILECSVGSSLAFWCVLGYIGLQACLCFVLAFLARKLPGNFNEAKFITFSMLIFCAVWLAFIPAYISSPGNYADAVESFAILASSFGLLFCLFASKSYIILLKPEKNTKQHLMGKEKK